MKLNEDTNKEIGPNTSIFPLMLSFIGSEDFDLGSLSHMIGFLFFGSLSFLVLFYLPYG